ncbi:glycoside hydrolase family 15 protein, partial [bacterium]
MQRTETQSIQHSIDVILSNQATSGAYLASPNFPTYRYSWFRDGSFIAYAMALYGEMDSAARFHHWAVETVARRENQIRDTVSKVGRGLPLDGSDFLHTRYTVDGAEAPATDEEWPNHQLDGFGTWLWTLAQYQQQSGKPLPEKWVHTAGLVGDYLAALWQLPCYDCWEEFPGDIHPHTLAAIYGGLKGLSALDGQDRSNLLKQIRDYVLEHGVYAGYFVKKIGSYTVDASLLGLALPYGLVALEDARFTATVERIEQSLRKGGGVHRYPTDTYFGGGEWVLLTAWLGWYYAMTGQDAKARELLGWIESQADAQGNLPEQVPGTLNDPN